jgi:hypothetical protein
MLIHITGASGSGTTTLGAALAAALRCEHLDADDFYWLPTKPPFKLKRHVSERLSLLAAALRAATNVVLSGSIVGWGREVEDKFDLIVFLYLETHIRVDRLRQRETAHLGYVDPEFLEWAEQYDSGPLSGRSLAKHRTWLSQRHAPVVELVGDMSVRARVEGVLQHLPSARAGEAPKVNG